MHGGIIMYRKNISPNDIISGMEANHTDLDIVLVRKAIQFAEEKHNGQMRKGGEPYVNHPLRVGRSMAEWGFGSEAVCAAILHDTVEDCRGVRLEQINELFGEEVAQLVNAMTAVDESLHKDATKTEIDIMSDVRFQQYASRTALFIKVADRLDNLNTIDVMPEKKQILKARHTRDILIPMMLEVGANYLVDQLEELCFLIEHRERFDLIESYALQMRSAQAHGVADTLALMERAFSKYNPNLPKKARACQQYIVQFTYEPRYNFSIYRQVSREAENLREDFDRLMDSTVMPYYDLTLIVSDVTEQKNAKKRPEDVFYAFFDSVLWKEGISIVQVGKTTHGDYTYYVLRGKHGNLYRFFVRSERNYREYRQGRSMPEYKQLMRRRRIDEYDPRDTYRKKIKIFSRDGEAFLIDDGATVLDFAFALHNEIGLHFKYAMIDESKAWMPVYTRLNEGDMVTIVTDEEARPLFKWINYICTNKAKSTLAKYFEREYGSQ